MRYILGFLFFLLSTSAYAEGPGIQVATAWMEHERSVDDCIKAVKDAYSDLGLKPFKESRYGVYAQDEYQIWTVRCDLPKICFVATAQITVSNDPTHTIVKALEVRLRQPN